MKMEEEHDGYEFLVDHNNKEEVNDSSSKVSSSSTNFDCEALKNWLEEKFDKMEKCVTSENRTLRGEMEALKTTVDELNERVEMLSTDGTEEFSSYAECLEALEVTSMNLHNTEVDGKNKMGKEVSTALRAFAAFHRSGICLVVGLVDEDVDWRYGLIDVDNREQFLGEVKAGGHVSIGHHGRILREGVGSTPTRDATETMKKKYGPNILKVAY